MFSISCLKSKAGLLRNLIPGLSLGFTVLSCTNFASATEISVGGGLLDSGLIGSYYDNTGLSGDPVFTRRDIRIDFDWGTEMKPGGGLRGFRLASISADNYSVRWDGRIMARFNETYTLTAFADAVRIWIKPESQSSWDSANLDTFGSSEPSSYNPETFTYTFVAGEAYDIRIEYREQSGPARMQLLWESPSTPQEVIQATAFVAQKPPKSDYLLADNAMSGTYWGEDYPYSPAPAPSTKGDGVFSRDGEGWPAEDFRFIMTPQDRELTPGTYRITFKGTAQVSIHLYDGETFASADGTVDYGTQLDIGEGYNPATNTTTVRMTLPDVGKDTAMPKFHFTDRDGDASVGGGTVYGTHTGVTELRMMRPLYKKSPEPHAFDQLFLEDAVNAMERYVAYRWNDVNDNGNETWSDRANLRGVSTSGTKNVNDEYKILWCNRTGHDLWLQVPHRANDDYVTKLAQLVHYGSDENYMPYTNPQSDPYHPPLNPNLKVYLEYSNEAPWNTAGQYPQGGWIQNRAEDFRQAWFANPSSPEGQKWELFNYDGQFQTTDPSKSIGGMGAGKRYYALRLKEISDLFRAVWGDENMPAPGKNDPRIRPNLTYQYDNTNNTARDSLFFIDNYFNKTDPASTYTGAPHPVNYYFYSGGPATYYASDDRYGIVTGHSLNDSAVGGFEGASITPGVGDLTPGNTPWRFEGTAGIHRQPDLVSPILGSLGSSTNSVDTYNYRGFSFTVGPEDIAVHEVGRYKLSGNSNSHNIDIYDAATNTRLHRTNVNMKDYATGEVAYALTGQENYIANQKYFTHPWILEAGKTYYIVSQESNNGDTFHGDATIAPPTGITINGTVRGHDNSGTWTWITGTMANRTYGPVSMRFTKVKTMTSDNAVNLGFLNMSKEDRTDQMRSSLPEKASPQALFIAGTGAAEIDVTFDEPGVYAFIYHLAYRRDQQPWLDTSGDGNPSNDQGKNVPRLILVDGSTAYEISPDEQAEVRPGTGGWSYENYWMKPATGYDFTSSAPFEITAVDVGKTFTLRIETDNSSTEDVLLMDNFVVSSTSYMLAGNIPGSGGLATGDPGVSGWESRVRNMYVYVQTFGLRATAYEGGWYPGGDGNKMPIQFAASFYDPKVFQGEINAMNALARAGMTVATDYTFDFAMPEYDLANADDYQRIQAWDAIHATLRPEADNGVPVNSTYGLSNSWWSNNGSLGALEAGDSIPAGAWASWNVIVPETDYYKFRVQTSGSGSYELRLDNAVELTSSAGGSVETSDVFLTKGLHAVRILGTSGSFELIGISGAAGGEAYGIGGLTGEPGNQKTVLSWNYYPTIIDGYHVYYRLITESDPNTPWQLASGPLSEPNYTVTGLTNDSYYQFAVKAVVNGSETGFSNSILLQPRVEAPVNPTLQQVSIDSSAGTVSIDWKLPDGTLPVSEADSVVIYYGTDAANLSNSVSVPAGTGYSLSNVDTSAPLYFRLEGSNAAGNFVSPVYSAYKNLMDFTGVPVGQRPVGWSDYRDPINSGIVTALVVETPNAPNAQWPEDIISPTGTPLLRAFGHSKNSTLTEDAAAQLTYYGLRSRMTWGGSNNYDSQGVNLLNSGTDSYLYAHIEADGDLWVQCRDGSPHSWKKQINLVPDSGEVDGDRVLDAGEWWTLDVRAYPATDGSDALDVHIRVTDETGENRLPATSAGTAGTIINDIWVLANVPKPFNGAQGTYGIYASNSANGGSPNVGHWFDSVEVFPLITPEAENPAPVIESAQTDVTIDPDEAFSYTFTVSDNDDVTLEAVQIPHFLTFVDNGDGTGTLSGTPSTSDAENWLIVLRASDGLNDPVTLSFALEITSPDTTPPTTPSSLAYSNVTTTSVDLDWNASTDDSGSVTYTLYENGTSVGSTTDTSVTVTGLSPETSYTYYLVASDPNGNSSGSSNWVTFTTLSETPPPGSLTIDFENLTIATDTETSFTLDGFVFNNSNSGGSPDEFRVLDTANGFASRVIMPGNYAGRIMLVQADGQPFSLTAFDYASGPGNNTGDLIVTATFADSSTANTGQISFNTNVMSKQTVNWSNLVLVTFDWNGGVNTQGGAIDNLVVIGSNDSTPPTDPSNLASSNVTTTTVDLSWTASTDDSGSVTYTLYENGVAIDTTTATSITVVGLSSDTSYSYYVVASDAQGNISGASNTVSITTLSGGSTTVLAATQDKSSQSGDGTETVSSISAYNRYVVQFDLSTAPAITSATLRLYRQGSNTYTFSLKESTEDNWGEYDTLSPNGWGTYQHSLASTQPEWLEFDVTSFIQAEAASNGLASFLLKSNNGGWHSEIHTRENSTNPPELIINGN